MAAHHTLAFRAGAAWPAVLAAGGAAGHPVPLRHAAHRPAAGGRHRDRQYQPRRHRQDAAGSDPAVVGDEPALLARRCRCPVWIGRDRVAAARALLAAHPECDVIISDDGLQHYRLRRDVEIAVVDGARGLGNGLLLPAGPLREPASRLAAVDAVVINGATTHPSLADTLPPRSLHMRLRGESFHNLVDPSRRASAADFRGKKLHAVAGIGNPRRFFDHLRDLGLDFTAHAFPDHYAFQPGDLGFGADAILMTEKDAVKCEKFAPPNAWALAVDAEPDSALEQKILLILRNRHGPQTA